MTYLEALILGIVQGVAEFLPISSSGHLVLLQRGFGLNPSLTLNVFLHVGSLGAIICYYFKDIVKLLKDFAGILTGATDRTDRDYLLKLLVATAITAVLGILMEDPINRLFATRAGRYWLSGSFLITAGVLASLFLLGRSGRDEALSWRTALIIGVVQGLAVFPGISRSGSTIVAAMLLGLSGAHAARFSFLLAIPVIGGAGLLEARHLGTISDGGPVAAGVIASFLAGFASLWFLVKLINRGRMSWFSLYLFPLAIWVAFFG